MMPLLIPDTFHAIPWQSTAVKEKREMKRTRGTGETKGTRETKVTKRNEIDEKEHTGNSR